MCSYIRLNKALKKELSLQKRPICYTFKKFNFLLSELHMNLRIIAFAIITMIFTPTAFANKTHHFAHHHHLSSADKNLLMYGTREELAEGYSQKCDENHQLKSGCGHAKLVAKGVAIGIVLSGATAAILYIATR